MIKKFIPFFFVFLFFALATFPQQNQIDSLLSILKNDKDDTNKVAHLNLISWNYINIGSYDLAIQYAEKAQRLAASFPGGEHKAGLSAAYNNFGWIFFNQGDFSHSLDYYLKSLTIDKELNNRSAMAVRFGNIGNVYLEKGDYPKALEYYLNALRIDEELGNRNKLANQLSNIGIIYDNQGNYAKALYYYERALKIDEEMGDKNGIASDLANIGVTYKEQGEQSRQNGDSAAANKYFGKALEYYFKALKIDEEMENTFGIGSDLGNIGSLYYSMGNNNKALEFFLKAFDICEKLENKRGMALWLGNIGSLYVSLEKYADAEKNLLRAVSIDTAIGSIRGEMYHHTSLSELYQKMGKYDKALYHYKKSTEAKDTLFTQEKEKDITRKEMNFEFEKKVAATQAEHDKQTAVAEAESRKQKIIIGLMVLLTLAAGATAIYILRSLKITRRQKAVIEKQKEIVDEQRATVVEKNKEISEKNKELTDSINYAKRIQSAILTSEQYLNDMFLPKGLTASHFILYKPKDIVAGDFYWAYKTPGGKAIWVAADCTGHGVPGAFMSMIGNSLLNEIVLEKGIEEPDEILNHLRAGVIKALGQSTGKSGSEEMKMKDGMDAALCCWDKATNKLSFAGANNCLWICKNENGNPVMEEILADSQPVGLHIVMNPFTKREIQLHPGDTIYSFTDGFCDQFGGPKGKKYKYKPFKELLVSVQDKSMPEQKEILNNAIEKWKAWPAADGTNRNMEQVDDICVFGVRV